MPYASICHHSNTGGTAMLWVIPHQRQLISYIQQPSTDLYEYFVLIKHYHNTLPQTWWLGMTSSNSYSSVAPKSGCGMTQQVLCLGSFKGKIKVLGGPDLFLEALGMNLLPNWFTFWTKLSSLWLYDWDPIYLLDVSPHPWRPLSFFFFSFF